MAQQLGFGPRLSFCTDQGRATEENDGMFVEETFSWQTQKLKCLYSESDELRYEFASCLSVLLAIF